MTKRKPKQYRDERGRFAHASPEVRAGLEAMQGTRIVGVSGPIDITRIVSLGPFHPPAASKFDPEPAPYCDEIYRPKKIGWLERALQWFTWNRSRA